MFIGDPFVVGVPFGLLGLFGLWLKWVGLGPAGPFRWSLGGGLFGCDCG